VLDSGDFGAAINLDGIDDLVILSASSTPNTLTGYREGVKLELTDAGVSYGRHQISTGRFVNAPLASPTSGGANSAPKVGPVIINEVMYNPATGGDEFLELHNISGGTVSLHDGQGNGWVLNGMEFTFPTDATIPAGGFILLVPGDANAFRAKYNIPGTVQIFSTGGADLDNGGEELQLAKPVLANDGFTINYINIDEVDYDDVTPWSNGADGVGPSLARLGSTLYGDDPASFALEQAGGTPGAANFDTPVVGTAGNDTFTLTKNGNQLELRLNGGANPIKTYAAGSLAKITIDALAGNDTINVNLGTDATPVDLTFNGGAGTSTFNVTGGQVSLRSLDTILGNVSGSSVLTLPASVRFSTLAINDTGKVNVAPGKDKVLRADALNMGANAQIDLADNAMIVHNGDLAAIRALLSAGRGSTGGVASGKWNGTTGITSSVARAADVVSETRALGYALNKELLVKYQNFAGVPVGDNDVLLRYTKLGDANLDGIVNNNDITILAGNYRPDEPPVFAAAAGGGGQALAAAEPADEPLVAAKAAAPAASSQSAQDDTSVLDDQGDDVLN
jgi:hypothetical protein